MSTPQIVLAAVAVVSAVGAVWAYVRNTRRRLGDAITRPVWALVLVFAVSANLTLYVK